jgi:hypothetical protein
LALILTIHSWDLPVVPDFRFSCSFLLLVVCSRPVDCSVGMPPLTSIDCCCSIPESRGLPRSHFVMLDRTSSYLQNFLPVMHSLLLLLLPVPVALL